MKGPSLRRKSSYSSDFLARSGSNPPSAGLVRMERVELSSPKAYGPKPYASASSATSASLLIYQLREYYTGFIQD